MDLIAHASPRMSPGKSAQPRVVRGLAVGVLVLGLLAGCKQGNKSTPLAQPTDPVTLSSGLSYQVLATGSGDAAKSGDRVDVHYTGWLKDGTKFDSSRDRDQPFTFRLGAGQVIKGWDLGVEGMKEGEKRKLTIPPDLGYGAAGVGPIPPHATLTFEVELLNVH